MAINFPDSPSNGDTTTLAGKTYTFDSSKSKWSPSGAVTLSALSVGAEATASGDGGIAYNSGSGVFTFTPAVAAGTGVTVHASQSAMLAADASSAVSEGSLHYDTGSNKLYVKMADAASGGFYLLASIINSSPTISSPSTGTAFELDGSPNPTTISIAASDSDAGQALNYYYTVSTGTIGSGTTVTTSATSNGTYASSGNAVAGSSNASTNSHFRINPSNSVATSFSLTFYVTDGTNIANTICSFTLAFTIPNSRDTSLLMSANAAGDNSTFTDSNTQVAAKTITASGNPVQGSFGPYRKGGYSVEFDGNDYLGFASSDFEYGTSDYTIEFYFKWDGTTGDTGLFQFHTGFLNASNSSYSVFIEGNGTFNGGNPAGGWDQSTYTDSGTLTPHKWYHFAMCRTNNVRKGYLDGIQIFTKADTYNSTSHDHLVVGGFYNTSSGFHGELRDFRFLVGTCLYSGADTSNANFTLPSEPLTAITNTKLLACSSAYIGDANTTPKSVTVYGDPKTVPSGPYDYSEANADDSGSIEFDATGDYLSTSTSSDFSFGTGDFTVECWVTKDALTHKGIWQISSTSSGLQTSNYTNTIALGYQNSVLQIYGAGNSPTASAPITAKTWFHVAYVRSSGVSKLYCNGTEIISQSDTTNYALTNMVIGGYYTTGYLHNGKISNLRVVKGTAVYTSNFTPPTEPLTAVTNTKLLLNGQGAKIFDKSQTQNFALSGAQGNATNKGGNWANTFSTRLASTSDYVNFYDKPITGTSDFTIEAFLKWDSTTGFNTALYSHYYSNSNRGVLLYNNKIYLTSASSASSWGAELNLGTPPSSGTWYHLAAVRNGANLYGFINGTRTATLNIGASFDVNDPDHATLYAENFGRIGAGRVLATTPVGYISDFRITHGFARYTAADETGNIPTAPLKG